ncbi:hypothetical protein M514_01194 [Trichuris suis]|uniref:Uncharacterized protein n=1 Tax=Trichuris suis TaxID=68888 RepID=A0A085ML65_9BILA|nr:hypothetical protein M513_01194 [Trichuris suis]KFD70857.1 hypothetical protein M514_01194 [Trichuris suis]
MWLADKHVQIEDMWARFNAQNASRGRPNVEGYGNCVMNVFFITYDRGRPPKSTPKSECISVFPSTYGDVSFSSLPENVDQGSKKKNSDEEE